MNRYKALMDMVKAPLQNTDEAYPECAKLAEVSGMSQAIGEFLEWMGQDTPIVLAQYGEDGDLFMASTNREKLLAEFFEIDLNKVEKERRAMLDSIRKANDKAA